MIPTTPFSPARKRFPFVFAVALFAMVLPHAHADSPRPNLVLMIADDCTYLDLGVYGGQAKTPNLNQLASDGMKFTRCFQAAPMCSPTRHCLYTGIYPVKSGAYPNHTMAYDWVQSIATYLNDAGYRSHLSGKTHIQPRSVFPFEYSADRNNPDMAVIDSFMSECASSETPFLLVAASNEPHSPWNKGDASVYPPDELSLPPVLVDSPDTRQGYSKYLAEITYFDDQVGQVMKLLQKHSHDKNTLVMVLSEQGNSFPFAKWTCYDVGVHSGCIMRWPDVVVPGSVSDAMVEYVDVVPTFLEACGIEAPDVLDGRSFLSVLQGESDRHKSYVFSLQTTRGINNGSDYYGIRSVRGERYRYVRNLTPEVTFKNAATADPTFKTWRAMAEAGDANAARLVHDYQHRPAEELYDCQSDPFNRENLISNPSLNDVRDELRSQLDQWMKSQGDQGQPTEMAALERMPRHSNTKPARPKRAGEKKNNRKETSK
ncbi:sulfatase family protein [Neorhodopirellula pilleata]|uniref:Arylsulfatase n=1 Tax=Neorhodopirellula pilleata TaxID=2714738 RepID=A0A5C6A2D4_9BACT|nr:sulfatase [Neorhodopirellula pilleata]TWT92653.1 Arylsulfatase precursor [Neorhodopirellula pilleata]